MEYRLLGRTGLYVSVISLGGWLTYGGHVAEEKTFECMKTAYDHGINFFDSAEAYAAGESEVVMGKAIKKYGWKRPDLVISTKLYWGQHNSSHPERIQNSVGLSRKHLIEGMNASLERLGLDYVDIVYAHRPDRLTPMEETVRAFNYLINKGQALYWGTSMWSAVEIADAWRVADKLGLIGPVVEQPEYNLLSREKVEKEYYELYERYGLGLTVFSPLKLGILTGKYNDSTIPEGSRFSAENTSQKFIDAYRAKFQGDPEMEKNLRISKGLVPIAKDLGVTQGSLALAWIMKNKNVSSIITGASRPEQIVENVKALEAFHKLTPEIMDKIDEIAGNKPTIDSRRFA